MMLKMSQNIVTELLKCLSSRLLQWNTDRTKNLDNQEPAKANGILHLINTKMHRSTLLSTPVMTYMVQ